MNFNEALQCLEEKNYVVWDDYLSQEERFDLIRDFEEARQNGLFKPAGIGKGTTFHLNEEVRKDEIYWFDENSATPVQKNLLKKLETLKERLNASFYLGLWSFEGHYAHYPAGGHYHAHLDRFSSDDARTISMVLYLNPDWQETDGGQLRIHLKDQEPVDILPLGGRLVCFLSGEILHEVLPAKRPRKSFAGWWKRR